MSDGAKIHPLIPCPLLDRVDACADRKGITRAALVVRALDRYVTEFEEAAKLEAEQR
jgi:metal-responsive CopG/Arc/MetJ family transcriptional regulator